MTPPPENGLTAERCIQLLEEALTDGMWDSMFGPIAGLKETDARAILAYLAAQEPDGNGWRPIETAPRDGRIIIGWSAGWESPTAIQWVDGYEWRDELGDERCEKADWDWNGTIQCPPSHNPSHWRPLPAPPNTRGGEG